MAVFPDRIVLKNSTDDQATIEAAIQTGGSDAITQGEIVLGVGTSDVKFYTKAGDGSIVSLGGTGTGATTLGELTDVDLSTPATDGQVIAYNSASGNWEPVDQTGGGGGGYTDPLTTDGDIVIRSTGVTTRLGIGSEGQVLTVSSGLPVWADATGGGIENIVEDTTPQLGGNLDTNTYYIASASGDVSIAPATGEMVVRGGTSEGKITLNCTANTHGVSIQSPPHSASATYTLTLPDSTGTSGQVLSTDGTGGLSWADNTGGGGGGGPSSPSYVGFYGSKAGTYDSPTFDANFPAGTQEGDLAVLVVYTRAGTEASFAPVTTPAGFALKAGPNEYTSASNLGYISSLVFTKIVEASDLGSAVTLTTSPVESNTDWFVGLSVFRNASYVDVEYLNTTAAGQQMPSSGYTYSGSNVSANSVSFFTAQSIYTVTNQSTRLTASTGEVNVMNGPIEDPSSTRRFTAWFMPQGSSDYNIRALNSSLNPVSLTEGFHIYRIDLAYLPPADSISLSTLQAETAAATDLADFQARIAAL